MVRTVSPSHGCCGASSVDEAGAGVLVVVSSVMFASLLDRSPGADPGAGAAGNVDRVEAVGGQDVGHRAAAVACGEHHVYRSVAVDLAQSGAHLTHRDVRSEERRAGKGGFSRCRFRWARYN